MHFFWCYYISIHAFVYRRWLCVLLVLHPGGCPDSLTYHYSSDCHHMVLYKVGVGVIFTHLKLWVAVVRHNYKWVKITPAIYMHSYHIYGLCYGIYHISRIFILFSLNKKWQIYYKLWQGSKRQDGLWINILSAHTHSIYIKERNTFMLKT